MREYPGKVLMLLENPFPVDARVKNEANFLTKAGYKVTVISLRKKGERRVEDIDGIRVYRIPKITIFKKKRKRNSTFIHRLINNVQSVVGYLSEYFYFTSVCFFLSIYVYVKEGFDVVHAHNPPDTLFVIGAFYKLFGKKFIFDHHDLSPELYLSRLGIKKNKVFWVLTIIEKLSLKVADVVIATNESYKEIETKRGSINPDKVFIVRNGPDLNRIKKVSPDEGLKKNGKKTLGYLGDMNPQDGLDYLLRALKHLVYELGRKDFFCILIGTGDSLEDLKSLTGELHIEDYVRFTGFIPDEDLIRYLSTTDICLDPDPSSPLNNVSTWIKIMEYMALGKPIVSFDLKETRFSAKEAAIYVEPNDEEKFAKAIITLMDNPEKRKKMGEFGRNRVEKELKWEIVGQNLLQAYNSLSI